MGVHASLFVGLHLFVCPHKGGLSESLWGWLMIIYTHILPFSAFPPQLLPPSLNLLLNQQTELEYHTLCASVFIFFSLRRQIWWLNELNVHIRTRSQCCVILCCYKTVLSLSLSSSSVLFCGSQTLPWVRHLLLSRSWQGSWHRRKLSVLCA